MSAVTETTVDAWDALRGLSLALDLVMGRRSGHAQATAALGLAVGRRLDLPAPVLADIALTALLKDAGCAASRPAFTAQVGTDDVAFHRHVFGMERYSPATFAALLWDLQRRQSDKATRRVWGWTNALLGLRIISSSSLSGMPKRPGWRINCVVRSGRLGRSGRSVSIGTARGIRVSCPALRSRSRRGSSRQRSWRPSGAKSLHRRSSRSGCCRSLAHGSIRRWWRRCGPFSPT